MGRQKNEKRSCCSIMRPLHFCISHTYLLWRPSDTASHGTSQHNGTSVVAGSFCFSS